ncbi:MAG: gfo/Idh/MocA family oxidoreductase [Chloroflexi bacterium]|jgi:predicted dehydrogenase|uniref:Gfo/Idh/MocA family oxidoreductase n=1 Tax=Candidatus Thermofonsia Clade 3 bacterium TaxID=2364212 RepID=A0A2M8Q9T5_9CHLR|nr:Gfo/Idh/MocA family oxidoreductase [Candidatus Roseilinea sp. NK_OTU-006]PJF46565.1 MAG: gfo/Idh/MocA family oxidoreductase [Candidatus Thermofonsia Clade 3 bacterium]RMG61914.1 MAG: gfo/Idh/MocA family oxidoreductase [Chloroflexota bacterium]
MTRYREFRNKARAINPRFGYLPDADRYVLALGQPRHRFNVIGCGVNGQEHIRVTMLEGRAVIHGVYDPNPRSIEGARREYAQFAPPERLVVYDSLEAACHDPAVDGLIIATPNHTHIAVLREAVKSGKHILLEKPMATTLQDAHEIMRLAEGYGAVLQVGLQYRYKPIYVEAIHEALTRRSIGEIKTITILEHREPFLDKVNQWNKFSKYSGGTLVEKCCHYFDLFNLFAQSRPVSVYAAGSQAVNFLDFEYAGERSDVLDNAFVIVTYANGVRANFNLCMFAPMVYEEIVLCGSAGRLKAYENEDFLPAHGPHTGLEVMRGEGGPSRVATPSYPALIEMTGHNGGTYFEHVNFIDRIEGRPTNAATAEEGFWSVVVGVAAETSVRSGQVVDIEALLAQNGIRLDAA